jgi:hypothetical protein
LQKVETPFDAFEENPSMRRAPAVRRVEDMFEQVKTKLPGAPKFLLCVLAERKNSDVYGWLFLFLLTSVAYFSLCITVAIDLLYRALEEEMPC